MIFLFIEFLDELVFGVTETAWPLLRSELSLTYTQIGLLLSVPAFAAALIEPFLGILGDVWKRRALILGGGFFLTASLVLTALSRSFVPLLISFMLFFPASGAFVSLSQATLMDSAPQRHEQNMARWTVAGSLGNVLGPILLGLAVYFGLGWRGTFAVLAAVAAASLLAAFRRVPRDAPHLPALPSFQGLAGGFRAALTALRRVEVLRWLILLEFSDLMLDVLLSFLALYFVDVVRVNAGQAGLAVVTWLALGLITDLAFIRYIDAQPNSVSYVRVTALLEIAAFSSFLILPGFTPKLIAIVFVSFFNTGWYPILQGRVYSALPGQSASLMAIGALFAPLGKLLPLLVGLLADRFGLGSAMWMLLAGPVVLLIGLPRGSASAKTN
ncbi:MAG TPA: MFS transporter [Anaerolineales bacterium]|jgi:FSR family fosmidomycin resistance protein-like MFS transporter